MKKVSLSLNTGKISSVLSGYIKRFHVIIYTLTVVIAVSVAMFMLNGLLSHPDTVDPAVATPVTAFDKQTIDRINNFNTAGCERDTFSLPPGRITTLAN